MNSTPDHLRSIHYSIDDILCQETCPPDCESELKKFYSKNGSLVEITDENSIIGSGGFGMVYKQSFHGKLMAMKCEWISKMLIREKTSQTKSDLEESIAEIRTQIASAGSCVIAPVAVVRQQTQLKDERGKWIAENYNIFIYPLYDCNLYDLHENHFDQFSEAILSDILYQCLTRKSSW